jgi:hypothetical protein
MKLPTVQLSPFFRYFIPLRSKYEDQLIHMCIYICIWTLGKLVGGGCGVDSPGSGEGEVVGCFEHGDEHSGSGATELVGIYIHAV